MLILTRYYISLFATKAENHIGIFLLIVVNDEVYSPHRQNTTNSDRQINRQTDIQ